MVVKPYNFVACFLSLLLLAACSSQQPSTPSTPVKPKKPLIDVNGAVPRFEPPSRIGNKDYEVFGQPYKVWNGIQQYSTEGTASWYGPGFHGKYTSNGELYNQEDISAAHKNLPLPSYLRVTNLENGRRLIVRVNDRGPFHGDRILDLSHGAASRLGIIGAGNTGSALAAKAIGKVGPLLDIEVIAGFDAITLTKIDMVVVAIDAQNARHRIGTLQFHLHILHRSIELSGNFLAICRTPEAL